jgi:hypothetical protein
LAGAALLIVFIIFLPRDFPQLTVFRNPYQNIARNRPSVHFNGIEQIVNIVFGNNSCPLQQRSNARQVCMQIFHEAFVVEKPG